MAGLFDKQTEAYSDARPTYPSHWFTMLAHRTSSHSLAWDVGTGNGQAAIGVAEHYEQVIGTDVSEAQLRLAKPHPRVRYVHTPLSMSDDELVRLIGGEGSVDLVTVAQAVHWFDLPRFYSVVTRVLRKPGGVFAVWGYNDFEITPEIDEALKRFHETTIPYWNERIKYVFDGYETLPFPFEGVGLGCEGRPMKVEIAKELAFEGVLGMLRSWSAVVTAKEDGVDLLDENVVRELERVWGGPGLVRRVVYKGFMLAGKMEISSGGTRGGVSGGEAWKAHVAMAWVQVLSGGYHVITKLALNGGVSEIVFCLYRDLLALSILAPIAHLREKLVYHL